MADGVTLSAGSLDGAKVATDEDTVGSTGHHQYVKVEFGADNTFTKVTSSVGLPVDQVDDATRDNGIMTVDGAVDIELAGTAVTAGAGAVAAGTPRVTLASDDPAVAKLGTIDTDTGNIATDTATIAGDTTAILADTANMDTNLGTVAGAVYTDDADWTDSSSKHVLVGGVYQSVPQSVTDGDTGPAQIDANGNLKVNVTNSSLTVDLGANNDVTLATLPDTAAGDLAAINTAVSGTLTVGSHAVTNAGVFATQVNGDALTALQLIDDAVHTDDAAFTLGTSKGVAMMGFAGTQSVDVNDAAVLACDTDGALHIADGGNVISVDDGAGSLTVDGTVAATQSGTWNVNNVSGTVSLPTGAATAANQSTANTALQLIDNASVNHDAASVAGVTQIGLAARSTAATAVGDGDAVRALATLLGKQVTIPYAIPAQTWSYAAANGGITNTTGVTAKAAAGVGIRNYVTSVQIVNAHDSTGTEVVINDGAAGTTLWRGWAEQTGGGVSAKFDPPLRGTANTLIEVACVTTGTQTYFNLQGYSAAE